jgi:carboxyl-terminal processing protease
MRLLLVTFSILLFQNTIHAQQPDSVRIFVDSALNIMQRHSMYAQNVNWQTVRDSAHLLANDATTYPDAAPALKYAFNQLQDKHGWLVLNDTDYHNPAFPPDTGHLTPALKNAALNFGGKVFSRRIQNYAYLNIPYFGGQSGAQMNAFAQRIQDSLCKAVTPAVKGIIIDLRLNGGGNVIPMLIGVSNVLGNGVVAQSHGGDGNITGRTVIENYSVTVLDTIVIRLQKACGDFTKLPVAVLIGPMTGSSGESVAIAFSTRPKTLLLGEETAGFTTSNSGFLLPGTNNGIVIGEDFMTDKNGKEYRNGVPPQFAVDGGDNYDDFTGDRKIKVALQWLNKQHL